LVTSGGRLRTYFLLAGSILNLSTPPVSGQAAAHGAPPPVSADTRLMDFQDSQKRTQQLVHLAQTDHTELLTWAMQHYQAHIQNYMGTFYIQERINGRLKKREVIHTRFMEAPYSVLMDWQKNAGKIDKLLYVEGQHDNKMIVHPTGKFSWLKSVKYDPRHKKVTRTIQRPCDEFGFYRNMESLLAVYQKTKYHHKENYLGEMDVQGRRCIATELTLQDHAKYPYARIVMKFDTAYCLPTGISAYESNGDLYCQYEFGDLRFNSDLEADAFTPKANGL
jgi:outer membrane lipoprotein-sorting protein